MSEGNGIHLRDEASNPPGGWRKFPDCIMDDYAAQIGITALGVYVCILRHADGQGVAYPSYTRIAKVLGIHRSTVIRAVKTLNVAGLITVGKRTGQNGKQVNLYQLIPTSRIKRLVAQSDGGSRIKRPVPVAQSDGGGRIKRPEREPLQQEPLEQEPRTRGGAGFSEFWEVYPLKQNKAAAQEAWGKLDPNVATGREIVAAVERQKEWDQWRRGVIPHASNWLTRKRWQDAEPPASRQVAERGIASDRTQYAYEPQRDEAETAV